MERTAEQRPVEQPPAKQCSAENRPAEHRLAENCPAENRSELRLVLIRKLSESRQAKSIFMTSESQTISPPLVDKPAEVVDGSAPAAGEDSAKVGASPAQTAAESARAASGSAAPEGAAPEGAAPEGAAPEGAVPQSSGGAEATVPGSADPPRWQHHGNVLWREWLKPLLIIGLVMFSFRSAVADWNDVPTGSMKPTILEGDRIFINKIAYDLKFPFTRFRLAQWKDPAWGDVVVLRSPDDGKRLVKRVVGLPGDTLELRGIYLVRNGEAAVYRMLDRDSVLKYLDTEVPMALYTETFAGRKHPIMIRGNGIHPLGPFEVPEGQFFVMGDNRNNSRDSRYFGTVERSAILGRATAVALSLDREHWYKPRWQRFFSKLP